MNYIEISIEKDRLDYQDQIFQNEFENLDNSEELEKELILKFNSF